jgi:hypothetical protein
MTKSNRECYTCGQPYYYCPTCPSETRKETFYNMFHCERCSKIFKTLTDETFKHLTTAKCKEELLKLNVSADEEFKDGIKKHIKRVFDYKEPIVKPIVEIVEERKENVTETKAVEKITEEVPTVESVKEEPIKKMHYVSRKEHKKIVK